MAVPPILGSSYLRKLSKNIGGKLKRLSRPLISGGIGDKMDKGNLWIVPGFTILIFACLWTTKLSKVALEESTCRGASIYDFTGTQLDQDAQRHCQTARRYYVAPEEPLLYDYKWKLDRQVKNPEWILWFWAPIVFIMYVITRFIWSLLLDNQGINFPNVVNAAESVTVENDGIIEIDEEKLNERLNVIAENFRCSTSSRAFSAFIAFEFSLVLAPICLLIFVLPIMIGPNYRSWGLDVIKAWWERKDWQGVSLTPVLGFQSPELGRPSVPLIPRITYCDYQFVSIGNSHTLTYRCYLDANWHERTALFIWIMLVFLTIVNFLNLIFWIEWAIRMKFKKPRRRWVLRKWLNTDEFLTEHEMVLIRKFASTFRTGNLLLFYYIEAHSSRVVASAFCIALFRRWLDRRAALLSNNPHPRGDSVGDGDASFNGQKTKEPIGWKLDPEEGDGLAPSPSEYYSPLETGESPENTMPFISPQHRYTDSSDSSNSKPEDREHTLKRHQIRYFCSFFFAWRDSARYWYWSSTISKERRSLLEKLTGGLKVVFLNVLEPLKPGGSGIKGKAPIMSSKERRRLEKEREKEKRRKEQQKGGGIEMLQEEENINGERSGRENRRFGCAVM
ncbi:Innexin [Meloidogyne graminicola]|uniref:Innexin n=1 Tax=Meloidogyne graminicola TaxID=189291 RepID=A0A8S9ZND0_9BILA|nr:Innexin [Meloidogyne graminicola]